MNEKESLVGKTVTLYLEGGWEITGEVKSMDEDKFIVEQDQDLFMIFKNKVSCLLLAKKARMLRASKAYNDKGASRVLGRQDLRHPKDPVLDSFPMNGINYDESSMSIPGGLLDSPPDAEEELSVFFKGGHSIPEEGAARPVMSSKINFRTEDDS